MAEFLQHDGELIHVCGYAAIYDSLSVPLDEYDGQRELIRPGAFDHVLRNLRASTTCTLFHMDYSGTIGSIFHRTLQLWSDDFGLTFSCGPLAANTKNLWAVRSIMTGGVRGCSWRGIPAEVATENFEGESVRVIKNIQHLSHISPGDGCIYPAAGTWCSHEGYDLPNHLRALALHWAANRPAAKPSLVARADAPRRQAPSTRASQGSVSRPGSEPHPGHRHATQRDRGRLSISVESLGSAVRRSAGRSIGQGQ